MIAQTVSTYFSDPTITITDAIVFDANGNLYGSDFYGDSVYKVTPGGVATTFISGLANPNGLAFDSGGNLFVVEYSAGKIHKYDASGNLLNSYPVSGTPSGLVKAYGSDDMIFTMVNDHSVNKLSTTGLITVLYQGAPLNTPVGLTYDDSGNLYAGNYIGREIYKITTTAEYVATVPDGGGTSYLAFITYGNGKLWATIFFTGHKIYEVNPNAVDDVTLFAGSAQGSVDGDIGVATFNSPSGILFNSAENALYISEFTAQGNVRKITGMPLSVENISLSSQITISPNPSIDFVELQGHINEALGNTKISIYDITGRLISILSQKINSNDFSISLNVSNLTTGLYTVHMVTDNGNHIIKKFIKK